MAAAEVSLLSFNRGLINPLALARSDYKRTALSAEVQTNWIPRTLGSMTLRPGWGYTGATRGNDQCIQIPFVFSATDTARIELTDQTMRVWVADELVTRAAVSTAVSNGTFDSDLTGWTDEDGSSATSAWATGGYLSLTGSGSAAAKRRQQVTVATGDGNVRHALEITVTRGPVKLRVGSTAGDDDYIAETALDTGLHSLAFTPAGEFWIDVFAYNQYAALVSSITVAASGTLEMATPWALSDLAGLRWDQSGDILFLACPGFQQRKIERRASDSWSLVLYRSDDGPFMIQNTGPVTIAPDATTGDTTLTASEPLFKSGHVGGLFKLVQTGQSATASATGDDQWTTPSIKVTGQKTERDLAIIVSGTFSATVTLQYSVGVEGDWTDAIDGSFTTFTSKTFNDALDNQIIFYRLGIKSGDYTSGTADLTLSYASGSQTGIARITAFSTSTSVSAQVLSAFGNTGASNEWSEGYWSDFRGYPSSVAFAEGRLWWAGKDRVWGSVSDDFYSFDDATVGDSGPISRSIGSGPVDTIHWLISLERIIMGADGAVHSCRSSSLDEPLTPTNFNIKPISRHGAQGIAATVLDTSGVFVQRGGVRVFEIAFDTTSYTYNYAAKELSQLVASEEDSPIIKIVAQHEPEKRLHCIREDGTVGLMIYDPNEEVVCWVDIETDGFVEDAVVLPAGIEDAVYYTVRRTIGGSTVRYHEKWASETNCRGYPDAAIMDAYVTWQGSASTTITGLSALNGASVKVWGWNTASPFTNSIGETVGRYMGVFTVSSNEVTGLPAEVTNAIVGLDYTAQFKSSKLAASIQQAQTLCQKKRVVQLGVIARWLHASGLSYGPDFDHLDAMPQIEGWVEVDANEMRTAYDAQMFAFPGEWDTDSRICLQAEAGKPVTLLAALAKVDTEA